MIGRLSSCVVLIIISSLAIGCGDTTSFEALNLDVDVRSEGAIPQPPGLGDTLIIRTDFNKPEEWEKLVATLSQSRELDVPYFASVDSAKNQGLDAAAVLGLADPKTDFYVFLADQRTFASAELPLLLVYLHGHQHGRTLRVTTDAFEDVAMNLSITNTDMEELTASASSDGVYRGYGDHENKSEQVKAVPADALRQATISSAENLLGRPLDAEELGSITVDATSGFPGGSVGSPLAERLEAAAEARRAAGG